MPVMTAARAQELIDAIPSFVPATEEQRRVYETMKVDYSSIAEMPDYKWARLNDCIEWIVSSFAPSTIDLCMSQLNGSPIDERTTVEQFHAKKAVAGKAKFSDWDFIVPSLPTANHIEQIAPLIKVDLFRDHHNGVRRLRVYG